jgi:hypothetical protein
MAQAGHDTFRAVAASVLEDKNETIRTSLRRLNHILFHVGFSTAVASSG